MPLVDYLPLSLEKNTGFHILPAHQVIGAPEAPTPPRFPKSLSHKNLKLILLFSHKDLDENRRSGGNWGKLKEFCNSHSNQQDVYPSRKHLLPSNAWAENHCCQLRLAESAPSHRDGRKHQDLDLQTWLSSAGTTQASELKDFGRWIIRYETTRTLSRGEFCSVLQGSAGFGVPCPM